MASNETEPQNAPEPRTAPAAVPVIGPESGAEPASEPSGPAARRPRRRKTALVVVVAVIVVLAAVYVAGALWFSSNFMPNTFVEPEGQDISGMSAEALAQQVSDTGASFSTTVTGDGVELSIDGSQVGLSYDGEAYARAAIEQTRPWLWPFGLSQSHSVVVPRQVTLSEKKLKKLLKPAVEKVNATGTEPQDATVSYDAKRQRFVPEQEEKGTKLDLSAVVKTVKAGMLALDAQISLGDSELKQPKVTSSDQRIVSAVQEANQYVGCRIPLTVKGKTVMMVNPSQIAEWVVVGADLEVSLDENAVQNWCFGPVSRRFDTIGAKRVYTRKDGGKKKKVTVSGGTYGWSTDSQKLAERIVKRLKAGSSKKLPIPMKSEAAVWNPGGRDWKAYIDVDLSEQKARYYNAKGKIVWSSKIVSGNPSKDHATPTGVYVITDSMGRNQTLIGSDENGDGKPDYKTPVSYWMPFVGNSVAFHDAPWRSAFGGKIYKSNGSHGCVNLPPSKAKSLYKMVKPGVVVSCHK